MYSSLNSLRNVRNEINDVLLKFSEEVLENEILKAKTIADIRAAERNSPTKDEVSQVKVPVSGPTVDQAARNSINELYHSMSNAINSLDTNIDTKFNLLVSMVDRLNGTMSKIVSYLENQTSKKSNDSIHMDSMIPTLQPISNPMDLSMIPKFSNEEEVEEEVEEEEVEPEIEEEEEVEPEVEPEIEPEVEPEIEEEEVSVEEWFYKGKTYFKDTNNIVYSVTSSGDPGDPIGQYDPLKNFVRKI